MRLFKSLEKNIEYIEKEIKNCDDIIKKEINLDGIIGKMYFVEEAVNDISLGEVLFGMSDVEKLSTMEDILSGIMTGNAVFIKYNDELKETEAIKIRGKGYPGMGVPEAKNEQVVRGSSEGFSDSYKTNEVLIRKRIRSSELKIEEKTIGVRSNTGVALVYMEGIVRNEVLWEVKKRLDEFKIDGFMDSGVIEQLTSDNKISVFPQYITTERPDRVAQMVLSGCVAILTDNSPVALVLPVNINTFLETSDDYYEKWEIASFQRILRYISVLLAMSLPAIYVSVVSYHMEILPENLVGIFKEARSGIPYSEFVEVFLMEIAFELIREAGVRIPGAMGNAIGIVGGLIVGSAAVDASLASPIVVIVVALTALCSFTIPNSEFSAAFRIIKYFLLFFSAYFGLYGYVLGIILVFMHLGSLESYGFPYLAQLSYDRKNTAGYYDFMLRGPYKWMTKRKIFARRSNTTRMKSNNEHNE